MVVLNFPKCVFFALKSDFFGEKIDNESPKYSKGGGGVTSLRQSPKKYQFFWEHP